VIRPEDIYVKEEAPGYINGIVTSLVFKGVHYEMMVDGDDGFTWMIHDVDPVAVGKRVGMTFDPDDIQIMRKSDFSPDLRKSAPDDAEQALTEDV
jgi:spermidine/putrescine transport system ATP-binding protein